MLVSSSVRTHACTSSYRFDGRWEQWRGACVTEGEERDKPSPPVDELHFKSLKWTWENLICLIRLDVHDVRERRGMRPENAID